MDLFFFDTLSPQYLDSYQQVSGWDEEHDAYGFSCMGAKRIVALSALPGDPGRWASIGTYSDICKTSFSLEQDSPEHPLLAGEIKLEDGVSRQAALPVNTLLSAIRIRSVSCDFSGRPYAGEVFNNTLIYLQYAGKESLPLGAGDGAPVSYLNAGRLDSTAVMALPRPDMILQAGLGEIGKERIYPDRLFHCYANPVREASLGTPLTRIVLEGDLAGHHCYYPIELPGLERACSYELDITLLRMGAADPDTPVRSDTVSLATHVLPWDTREATIIKYKR
ncbi:MAG: hypothetical protein J5669_02975 [Bacteroidales bacterium]|nr:hypothetical protein [Bacteroidales bacterium]